MPPPKLVLRTAHYTEGVVVASDGTIFFSTTSQGTISSIQPGSAHSTVWANVPAANGHAIDNDGAHIVMSSAGSIVRLDESGRIVRVVASQVADRWLTYPNDVALDPRRGGYYITDSGYKATPTTMPVDPQGRVYRIDANDVVREVTGGIAYANGIALSRDGSRLFIGESTGGRIWAYAVADDGSLGERILFATTPQGPGALTVPDGFLMDPCDRLYVAHYGARELLVYDMAGTLVDRLPAGNKATSHAAFSVDGNTLYVSGGIEDESGPGAIFAIAL